MPRSNRPRSTGDGVAVPPTDDGKCRGCRRGDAVSANDGILLHRRHSARYCNEWRLTDSPRRPGDLGPAFLFVTPYAPVRTRTHCTHCTHLILASMSRVILAIAVLFAASTVTGSAQARATVTVA